MSPNLFSSVRDSDASPIATACCLGPGCLAFTTVKDFDPAPQTPWREAGNRLFRLFEQQNLPVPHQFAFAGQVHGNRVAVVPDELEQPDAAIGRVPSCDSLVTANPGVFLVIRTADCLPISLVDSKARVVAVIHAGWRGTMEDILGAAVTKMLELGARPERISGSIGPRIGKEHYEVDPDLLAEFNQRWGRLGKFSEGRKLDLSALNLLQARAAGLEPGALSDLGHCTYSDAEAFYSHRRQGRERGQLYTVCGFAE